MMNVDTPQSPKIKKTWKPGLAGTLIIIGGLACGVLGYIALTSTSDSVLAPLFFPNLNNVRDAIVFFLFAILSIIGGILCIGRKMWGVAIAGSVVVFLGLNYCITNFLAYIGLSYIVGFFTGFEGGDPSFYISPLIFPIKIILLLVVIDIAAFVFTIIGNKEFE